MAKRAVWMTVVLGFLAGSAVAGWPSDPMVNVPLCNAVEYQAGNGLTVVPSVAGGVIAAWQDDRDGDDDIYAQRVDSGGEIQWTVDGVPVCTAGGAQAWVQAVSDGTGGAIIVWIDTRDGEGDLYAQRIGADGAIMWPVGSPSLDGVPVCNTSEGQSWTQVVSDGAGGVIVTWEHGTNPNDLHAQRLNADGEIQWPAGAPAADGVVLSASGGVQIWSRIVSDGAGGAILVWTDGRNNPVTSFDIYAQRINGSGLTLWVGDVPVCTTDGAQTYPAIATDGLGGAFITWFDNNEEIWAQRLNSSGARQWTAGGIMINDSSVADKYTLRGVGDGPGAAIFVWEDLRDYPSTGRDLYAQRLNSGGPMWTGGGVVVSAEVGNQRAPAVGAPRDGSVVIAWRDGRDGESTADIYSIEIVDGSSFVGPPNGLAVSTADYGQWSPVVGTSGFGDAVLVWPDGRNIDTWVDVYAQGVFLTAIFADGFESGGTSKWDSVVP